MDPDSIPIYAIALVVLILLSAFFSASETAYSSLNRARLKTQLESGKATVRRAYALSENYDRLLFTILVGNNIVNITATTVSTLLFALLIRNESVSATVSTAVMTVLVLLFGEITPKTIAKEMPERFACAVSYPLSFFIFILYPLTLVFTGWKALLRKVFRFRNDDVITEEELLTYVEEAGEDGTLDKSETDLISSAIEFNESEVGDILVPRVNVIAVNIESPMEDIQRAFLEHGFSRLPVYKGSVDSIVGMIHEKDFYAALMKGAGDIRGIVTSVALATEHMRISVLLRSMQRQKVHLAVVVDEYGGTLGIVTLEDILEELVGEIWDEHDEVVDYFNKLDDKTYLVDGNAELTDFFELFSLEEDEEIESNTVSGWVIEKCGDIPPIGYTFEYKQLKIEVTKRNLKKVLEIKVTVIEEEKEETED
ncbi:MAG: hemolysin family protein [Candidatus Borkfalkiaceae bacterium]|nr:hemolysin family protein [Christensenellaceae bacterium]